MLVSTRGIVLRNIKFRETSIITNIFTEELGNQAYIINGIRSPKSKRSMGALHPLGLLNLVVYNKKGSEINRLSEFKPALNLYSITGDVKKSSTAVFISEVLFKSIRDHSTDRDMFEFVFSSIQFYDTMEVGYANFHLQFLLKFTKYLGFGLDFGLFEHFENEEKIISQLLNSNYDSLFELSNEKRRIILKDILRFYQSQMDGFGNLKSLEILNEVFS